MPEKELSIFVHEGEEYGFVDENARARIKTLEENGTGGGTVTDTDTKYNLNYNEENGVLSLHGSDNTVSDVTLPISTVKFPNVTIIGQPTINEGQISNFSTSNYLQFPFTVNFQNRPFEITFDITTGSNVSNQQNIIDSQFGLAFAVRSNRFVLAYSTNGTSWTSESTGTHTVTANTDYLIKISWSGTVYKVEYSTNGGETFITDITKNDTISPYPKQVLIGVGGTIGNIQNYFTGVINLNKSQLVVSNKVVWLGMDDVGVSTRMAVDLSNIDNEGVAKIEEIVNANKATAITDANKNSTTMYPSNKAMTDYVDSKNEDIKNKLSLGFSADGKLYILYDGNTLGNGVTINGEIVDPPAPDDPTNPFDTHFASMLRMQDVDNSSTSNNAINFIDYITNEKLNGWQTAVCPLKSILNASLNQKEAESVSTLKDTNEHTFITIVELTEDELSGSKLFSNSDANYGFPVENNKKIKSSFKFNGTSWDNMNVTINYRYVSTNDEIKDISIVQDVSFVPSNKNYMKDNWNYRFEAYAFHDDGSIDVIICDEIIYSTPAIADFKAWDWTWITSSWANNRVTLTTGNANYIYASLDKAITPQEVKDYYDYLMSKKA